jgi:integrase
MKLTKDNVATLKSNKRDVVIWDDSLPGFGVRIRGAKKSWLIQYRVGSQQRRESFGDIRKVTIDDARSNARKRFAQVELGADPAAERHKAREESKAVKLTLGNVAERYLEARGDRMRPSTRYQATLHLTSHWSPLSGRPIAEIKRAEIAARLQELTKECGRSGASRARANLSACFTWAMKEGLCEINPVMATNDPEEGVKPRERVLSDSEVKLIWNACGDDDFGRIIKLLLLTGCRRSEIGALRWAEIDGDLMTLPGSRTKNHKAHSPTLPPLALEILESIPREGREYVFGGGDSGFTTWSICTALLRRRAGVENWTLHDLRRTMRTGLARLGVPPHVAELTLNHPKPGLVAVYDRYSYEAEIANALARWADHVAAVVAGRESNVTILKRA